MKLTAENPHVLLIHDIGHGGFRIYQIDSEEQLNLAGLDFIKQEMEDYGCFRYLADIHKEQTENQSANIKMTEAEVESLPQHLRTPVQAERRNYQREEEDREEVSQFLELIDSAIKNNDPSKGWELTQWAEGLGVYEEVYRISIEELRVVK